MKMLTINLSKKQNNVFLLVLSGEFDFYEQEMVLDTLPLIVSGGCKGLIIDLSDVTLLTGAAIDAFIIFLNRLKDAGIRMAVVTHHKNYPVELFKRVGVFAHAGIELFETTEEAEAAIGVK